MTGERLAEFRRGRTVLLTSALGLACGLSAIPFYALSSFMAPLHADFGWSRGQIGIAATILTVMQFLTGPLMGHFCDRYGVRRLLLPSALLFALALGALALVRGSIWSLYGGYLLVALSGSATTSVAYSRVVNTWFDRSRGLALGITMAGSGVTAFVMPLLLSQVIGGHGWRTGYLACAVAAIAPLPLLYRFLHERAEVRHGRGPVLDGLPVAAALRSRQFWTLVAAAACFSPAIQTVVIHLQPILADTGFTGRQAARTASLLGLGMIAGRFLSGMLLDRFHGPTVGMILFLIPIGGYLIFYAKLMAFAPLAVATIGISIGVEGDLFAYFTARYFGMRSYAELFGWVFGVMCIAGACGPLIILLLPERGVYHTVLPVFAGLCVIAAALLRTLGTYPQRFAVVAGEP
jgi:MFS family permease